MADNTGIEWTDATWNPVTGCTKVSPGCDHCYAEGIAKRFAGTPAYPAGFAVTLWPDRLDRPIRWAKPRRIFVNSMSDLFHADIPDDYVARVFAVMATAGQHTYQVLTKRHGRMRSLLSSPAFREDVATHWLELFDKHAPRRQFCPTWADHWPLPNVWLGVSVEDQRWAQVRVPALLDTPAAVRWVSAEPLLGPLSLHRWLRDATPTELIADRWPGERARWTRPRGLDWVVAGGESGRAARPMHPAWPRQLRDQCAAAGVPFLFKQWGEWAPGQRRDPRYAGAVKGGYVRADGGGWAAFTVDGVDRAPAWMLRVGKKAAGRTLDGVGHDGYPVGLDTPVG